MEPLLLVAEHHLRRAGLIKDEGGLVLQHAHGTLIDLGALHAIADHVAGIEKSSANAEVEMPAMVSDERDLPPHEIVDHAGLSLTTDLAILDPDLVTRNPG